MMIQTIKLLIPALIPSWRFFDEIAPSPRVEYRLLKDESDKNDDWLLFRPKPQNIALSQIFISLFYNPKGNDDLFMTSCAERLMQNPTSHSENEIRNRIREDVISKEPHYFQFRLVFIVRENDQLNYHVTYISDIYEGAS